MDYGLCLPNFREGASREGMKAAAEAAERRGTSVLRFAREVAPLV